MQARGKAELGDKTMIDALRAGGGGAAGGRRRRAARWRMRCGGRPRRREQGMQATVPLVARKGRASYLGERSAGHQDPGATSSWLLLRRGRASALATAAAHAGARRAGAPP